MDYEKRYNELIEAIKEIQEANPHDEGLQNWVNDHFHELAESEDEKIKKELKRAIAAALDYSFFDKETADNCLNWLEKQGEPFDDNIITRDDEILQAISVGLTDVWEDLGWSDFGGLPIEEIQDWLDKQGKGGEE